MFARDFLKNKKNMISYLLWGGMFSAGVSAELKPINDSEMSNITGQAFFTIDKTYNPSTPNLSYTRLNIGMDIEVQANIDKFELGRYDRPGEAQPADILFENMSLGYIYDEQYQQRNSNVPRPKRYDGNGQLISYQDGDIVPFKIKDPFLEFAFDGEEVVGARIGFGEAQGLLSMDIKSFTGNVDIDIKGTVNNLRDALRDQGCGGWLPSCGFVEDGIVNFGGVIGNTQIGTKANLIQASGGNIGSFDPVRATSVGILDGEKFTLDILGGIDLTVNDCSLLGITVCFPLEQFKSLHVSNKDTNGNITGPAEGLFLSFQTKDLAWMKDVKGSNTSSNYMNAVQGAFFNVPTGGLQVDFVSSLNGIERARTEYIDRGRGLF
jgi:hypothetical protein